MTGLIISTATVLSLIFGGYIMRKRNVSKRLYCTILGISSLLVLGGALLTLTSNPAHAAEAGLSALGLGEGLGFVAAAIATAIACVAAGYAVAHVGAAAIGLVGEKPEMLGTTLIYLGLAEGIAIYGVIISLMILQKF